MELAIKTYKQLLQLLPIKELRYVWEFTKGLDNSYAPNFRGSRFDIDIGYSRERGSPGTIGTVEWFNSCSKDYTLICVNITGHTLMRLGANWKSE